MTCPYCVAAEAHPVVNGVMNSYCMGCQARRLATSPLARTAVLGHPEQLQQAIQRIWKDDYAAGRAAVWEWMERIKAWQASTKGEKT